MHGAEKCNPGALVRPGGARSLGLPAGFAGLRLSGDRRERREWFAVQWDEAGLHGLRG